MHQPTSAGCQRGCPPPGFYPPLSNFLWPTLGVILGISASLLISQLGLMELVSIFLNVIITLAAYGAVVGLTKNNWVGLIAAVFAATSPSQYWHSAGLYRTMLGISLAFVTLSAYHRSLVFRNLKNIILLWDFNGCCQFSTGLSLTIFNYS
jgi:hypothetical protein